MTYRAPPPQKELEAELLKRFLALPILQSITIEQRIVAFNYLLSRYGEEHRKYHVLLHIWFCLQIFDLFRHLAEHPHELELAIFYHDIVYDIGVPARQNEERSAELLMTHMEIWGFPSNIVSSAANLILDTTHDHVPKTGDGKLIVDIDLAGLGAPWEVFLENNRNVRQEYKQYSDEDFRAGNSKVLQQFLDRRPLYYHPEIEAKYGEQARANLTRWLNRP